MERKGRIEKKRKEKKGNKEKKRKRERRRRKRKKKGKNNRQIWDCTARGKEPLLLWITSFLRVVLRPDLRPCVDCVVGILYATTCIRSLGGHGKNLVIS